VEAGAERMFAEAVARRDPVLFVVAMMDKEQADFDAAYASIKARLTDKVVPVEVPLGAGAGFRGIVNLFTKRAHFYAPGSKPGEYTEGPIPPEEEARVARYHAELVEAVAATDDALLERFFDGEELPGDEEMAAFKAAMQRQQLYPLLCCSALQGWGCRTLLDLVLHLMPSAYEMEELHALTGREGGQVVTVHPYEDAPFCAQVFKTVSEPHVGEVSYLRTFSGVLVNGAEVYNATRDGAEKLGHVSLPQGRERVEVPRVFPGDIICVAKLRNTHTGDTLSTRAHPVRLPDISWPEPLVHFAVRAAALADEEKLQAGLARLHDEDPTITVHYDPETHETVLGGLGERQLELALARLERQHGVQALLAPPAVAYRETLLGSGQGQGRHKKQTGGKGQFGDCWIRLSPQPRGAGYAFTDEIKGGVIPGRFVPAVDKGVQEAAERGVLAGYPLVDFACAVYDGSHHSVDSNEMAFKMAGILAFRAVAPQCRPVLLEPLDELALTLPESALGDVLGDLSSRRAQILGTDVADGGRVLLRALVPRAELHVYATTLQSLTQGRAAMRRQAAGYEVATSEVVATVAKARQAGKEG
jgi:elongation factor G